MAASAHVCVAELSTSTVRGISFTGSYIGEAKTEKKACKKALKTCRKVGQIREKSFNEIYSCDISYSGESYGTELIEVLDKESGTITY